MNQKKNPVLVGCCVLFCFSFSCRSSQPELNSQEQKPWLVQVKASIEASEYQLKDDAEHNGWAFYNRAQGVRVRLDKEGRAHVGLREGGEQGFWLRTQGLGRGEGVYAQGARDVLKGACVEHMAPDVDGGCIRQAEIWNGHWMEWWKNTPEGIEQGWKVEERLEGEGALYVDVQVGDAEVEVSPNQSAAFVRLGDSVMQYGSLAAWDAVGKMLPMWLEKTDAGVRVWVDDEEAVYPVVLDPLLTAVQRQLESNQVGAEFGYSVASAGDVNGDGYGDVVVGAYKYTNGQGQEGAAFVYHGSSSGLSNTVSKQWESNQGDAYFGVSVSSAGDVNGDGYGDVVVGAHAYDNGQTNEGGAFVYHGSSSGLSNTVSKQWESDQASAEFGYSVASARDVNGDGYGDVVVGVYNYTNGQSYEGAAFVYHGSSSGLSNTVSKQWESNQGNAYFGYSVASAGDVNGDGYGDVVVGVYKYDNVESDEGAAFVYHGSSSGLSNTVSKQLESNQASALFGASVASVGDVNGDGYGDVVVGAYSYSNGQSGEGAAFVYHGSSSGLSNTVSQQWESNQASAQFGISVSSAGDVNGDGYGDVVVGANSYDNGSSDEGSAFVYHGSSSGFSNTVSKQWESNQAGGYLGYSVAPAGDVNGDGYGDVVVGMRQYTNGQSAEGAAFVYHGSSSGLSNTVSKQWESNQDSAQFGISVSSAGDVNGDGYGDVVVGMRQYTNGQSVEGAAFVYHGSSLGLSNSVSKQLEFNQSGANFGVSVASAGDVNGDGYGDVVVGAGYYDNGQADEGAAFVYHGSSSGLSNTVSKQWESNQASALFGVSVASAGDVNGDGYGDVVVGAYAYDNGETNEGAAFVYHGSSSGLSNTVSKQWESNQDSAYLGVSVSSAGDVNGDAYGDVVVGASAYDNGEPNEGAAFVYHGSSSGLSNTVSQQCESNQASAYFAVSVSSAGDVNGDGYGDMVVGAYGYTNGQAYEGAAFVYHGSSSGLSNTVSKQWESNQDYAYFGISVASTGDVNGDGYADVVVGANGYTNGQSGEGAAFVYMGNSDDSGGSTPVSQGIGARRVSSTVPVSAWGKSETSGAFDVVALTARPPSGRAGVKLQVETKVYNAVFDGSTNLTTASSYTDSGVSGASLRLNVSGLSSTVPVKWRARVLYDPSDGVAQVGSPWIVGPVIRASSSNTAPTLTSVSTLTGATEDTAYTLSYATLLAASDAADAQNDTLIFRIEAVSTGTLTLSGTAVTAGTTTLSSGQSLVWTPASDANGTLSAFTVKVYDGSAYSSTAVQVSVQVTAVNDAPTATNLSAAETYTEDTTLNLTDIVVSDIDSSTVTATLTLSSPSVGSLSTATSGAVTSTFSAGVWTASGALANVNTLLAGVSFIPASNVNSNFTLATSISDGVAAAVTGTKTFTGTAVNDAPTATNLSAAETYTEDTTLNLIDIVVSDVDSSTVTATLTLSSPSVGSLSTATSGAVTSTFSAGVWSASGALADVNTLLSGVSFIPTSNENSSFTLVTSISDGVATAVTGTKTFTGTAVNDAPVAVEDATDVDEGSSVNVDVLDNDSDIESTSFVVGITEYPLHAGVVLELNGTITYTHDGSETTSDEFSYSIEDEGGLTDEAVVTVTVHPVNDTPVLTSVSTLTGATEDTAYEITYTTLLAASNATDAENDTLVFSIEEVSTGTLTLSGTPVTAGVTTLSSEQSLVWTPASNANGTLPAFTVKVYDGSVYSASAVQVNVQVASVNDTPHAQDDDESVPEGGVVHVSVLTNDSDVENDTLSVDIVDEPSHGIVQVESDGSVTYTHDGGESNTDSFTYTVSDGNTTSSIAHVTLTVVQDDDAPVMTALDALTGASEDTAFNITYATLLEASNATDAENDVLFFRVEDIFAGALLRGAMPVVEGETLLAADESLTWTPPLNQNGTLSAFNVRVWDGLLGSEYAVTVQVEVGAVNDNPQALEDNAEVDEGGTVSIDVMSNDTDIEHSPLTVTGLSNPSYGQVTLLPNQQIRYVHDGGESTEDSFTYQASDGAGVSEETTVHVTVHPVNDAPVLTSISLLRETNEDQAYEVLYAALKAASNVQDPDNETVYFALQSVTSGTLLIENTPALPGALLGAADLWIWMPAANAKGSLAAFTVKAWDGEALSGEAVQVSVRVVSVNDAPVMNTMATLENGVEEQPYILTHALLTQAGSPSDVDGNPLGFVLVRVLSGSLMQASTSVDAGDVLSVNDTWTWTPDADVYGETAAFEVKVTDGVAFSSTPVVVRVNLQNVPDAPRTEHNQVVLSSVEEDTAVEISYATLVSLSGASDVDGHAVVWVLSSEPSGLLTLNNNPVHNGDALQQGEAWVWTPAANATGDTPAFNVKARDGELWSEEVQVKANIEAHNDAPVAVSDVLTLPRGFNRDVDVLGNDMDVDSTIFTLEITQQPLYGTAEIQTNNLIRYTHDNSTHTQDSFAYRISDGQLWSESVQVLVTVAPNQAPTLTQIQPLEGAQEDTAYTLTYENILQASNLEDLERQPCVFQLNPSVNNITTLAEGESLTWTPESNANGLLEITQVKAFDGEDVSNTWVPLRVQVAAVNDMPFVGTIQGQSYEHPSSHMLQVYVSDVEDTLEQLQVVGVDTGFDVRTAKVYVDSDGDVLNIETLGFAGNTIVRVVVTDSEGGYVETFFDVEVTCQKDANNDGTCGDSVVAGDNTESNTSNVSNTVSDNNTDTASHQNTRKSSCAGCAGVEGSWLVWWVFFKMLLRKKRIQKLSSVLSKHMLILPKSEHNS